jgi:hypothetical protein
MATYFGIWKLNIHITPAGSQSRTTNESRLPSDDQGKYTIWRSQRSIHISRRRPKGVLPDRRCNRGEIACDTDPMVTLRGIRIAQDNSTIEIHRKCRKCVQSPLGNNDCKRLNRTKRRGYQRKSGSMNKEKRGQRRVHMVCLQSHFSFESPNHGME